MGWLYILLSSVFEIVGIIGIKKLTQEKNYFNLSLSIGGFISSLSFLYLAFQYLPISIAYATWTGIVTASAVIVNMLFFYEAKNLHRIFSLFLIVVGVIGLKAVS